MSKEDDIEAAADYVEGKLITKYNINIKVEAPRINDTVALNSIIMDLNNYFSNLNKGYKVLEINIISALYDVNGNIKAEMQEILGSHRETYKVELPELALD